MTMKYFRREIGNQIHNALNEMPVVVITGMRQTGKSTFCRDSLSLRIEDISPLMTLHTLRQRKVIPRDFLTLTSLLQSMRRKSVLRY